MQTIRGLLLGLLAVGASAWAADPAPEEKTSLKVGEKAPAFTLKDQAGKERTLDELHRSDGGEVSGGLKAVKTFLDRQAVAVAVKAEKKDGKEVVTELRLQPAGKPGNAPQKPPEKPQDRKPEVAPARDGIQLERDVEYGRAGDISLKLDSCRPKELPKEPMPVVIYLHGGGWKSGDKGDILARKDPVSTGLLRGGYCFLTINYRLSGVAPFPAAVEDCKCAVRWVRANAKTYHLDPDRIGVWGTSSGGHLALMVACADEKAGLEGKGGHADISSRVQAVCAWYPATDFTKGPGVFLSGKGQKAGPGEFIGGTLEEKPEACKQATIATHVSRDDPPTLLIHGTKDPITPFWQSESLAQKMKEAGVDVTLITVKNAGHGFGPGGPGEAVAPAREELFMATLEFFDRHLKSKNR